VSRPLDAVIARLEAQGCGVAGVSLFAGSDVDLPSGSPALLSVAETGGRAAIGTHQNPSALRQPGFQIAARADRYEDAAALADQAYAALNASNLLVDDVFFLTLRAVQEPFGIGTDAHGRPLVAFNLSTVCRRAA